MSKYVRKTDNPRMGRPKIDIKQGDFEKLCMIMCTKEDIAGFFECSVDTIENFCHKTYKQSFSAVYKTFSGKGKVSLRRYQWNLAQHNTTMAIFLGKQYLGQVDSNAVSVDIEDLRPLADLINDDEEDN